MREYQDRQMEARYALDRRKAEVFAAIPEYKQLSDSLASLATEKTIASITNNTSSAQNIQLTIDKTVGKMHSLLTESGYPADYLEPVYVCPKCKDTGYVDHEKCTCLRQAEIKIRYKPAYLDTIFNKENFDSFNLKFYPDNIKDEISGKTARESAETALEVCEECAVALCEGKNAQSILLLGSVGTGKTFLSNCIAGEVIKAGKDVVYMSAIDLFDEFSKSMKRHEDDEPFTQLITDCDLLIIDDLGTELANSFTDSRLFYCINSRMISGKCTVISTNLTFKELLGKYSERIFSRLSSSYKMLRLWGDDIRINNK